MLSKELKKTQHVVKRLKDTQEEALVLKKAYRLKISRLKQSSQSQQQQIRALHTTVAKLRLEIRKKLGLVATAKEITNEELAAAARKNIMINDREYSLSAYEAFRDVVCGSGLALNQVKFITNRMFKLITGVDGNFKVSRTVVKDAVMALSAADDAAEVEADKDRKHQLIFDESAHILILASSHWNADLSLPEITVLAAVRLDKQTGLIVATLVDKLTSHIPASSIINALSDNCAGMDGKYKGAMVILFRLLRARASEWQDEVADDLPAIPAISNIPQTCYIDLCDSDSDSERCMPGLGSDDDSSDDEEDSDDDVIFTLKSKAAAKSKAALAVAATEFEQSSQRSKHSRHTRASCMTHLGSIMHDAALTAACGKSPGYKQGMVKINHLITYLLQQHYIWDASRVSKLLVCKDLCGISFDHQTTEPDLNRWLYTYLACNDAVDPDFQFKSTMYYLAATTSSDCNCDLEWVDGSYGKYVREGNCNCTRKWISSKANCKEARQLLWYACLHEPKKGAEWHVSILVRLQLLAEFEFSSRVINPFHHWTISREPVSKSKWRSKWSAECWPCGPEYSPATHLKWKQLPAGFQMGDLSHYVGTTLQCCDKMEAALDANCWTSEDVLRYQKEQQQQAPDDTETSSTAQVEQCSPELLAHNWSSPVLPSKYEVNGWSSSHKWLHLSPASYKPPEMYCPLEDTITVARQCLKALGLRKAVMESMYRKFKKSMEKWITGYVKSCRIWLPRLLLLPFAIGQLKTQ